MKPFLCVALAAALTAFAADKNTSIESRLEAERARRQFFELSSQAQQAHAQALTFEIQSRELNDKASAAGAAFNAKLEALRKSCDASQELDSETFECKSKPKEIK